MAGSRQVAGPGLRIDGRKNGGGAVGRADAGGRAVARVNGFAERRAVRRGVVGRHQRQAQLIAAVFGKRQTNQSAPEFRHEVDGFRGHHLRRHREIAFVFAVFIVHQDDHLALTDFLDGFFDCRERCSMFRHTQPFQRRIK